jgi:hypothetical protein
MPPAPPASPQPPSDRRLLIFVALSVAAIAGVVGYALYGRGRDARTPGPGPATTATPDPGLAAVSSRPHVMFRNTALGPTYGRLSLVAIDTPDGARYPTGLSCDRVHGTRAAGFCLQASRGVFTTYQAVSFDETFHTRQTFTLAGAPSRTRVARTGTVAASTVFVSGDSYNAGSFSTRTTIFDLGAGRSLGDLEAFVVEKDGQPFKKADFNFWGVTFSDDPDRFYATLGTGGALYLVEGHVARRTIRILRDGVECPSLSPDGTRIAFKSRTTEGGRLLWRVHVLTLESGSDAVVSESRSVDDQVEWLDSAHLLYALPSQESGSGSSDVWVVRADGTGAPRLLIRDASSPAVVR